MEETSVSRKMADCFYDVYSQAHPEDSVEIIDLPTIDFPEFSADLINYFNGVRPTGDGYEKIDALCDAFCEADRYVFAMPHWNLIVPPKVIAYSLCTMRAGRCFKYTEAGPVGLLKNKQAAILLASGGTCNTENPIMHCYGVDWLKGILGLCGITDIATIFAQGMEERPQQMDEIVENALIKVNAFAQNW